MMSDNFQGPGLVEKLKLNEAERRTRRIMDNNFYANIMAPMSMFIRPCRGVLLRVESLALQKQLVIVIGQNRIFNTHNLVGLVVFVKRVPASPDPSDPDNYEFFELDMREVDAVFKGGPKGGVDLNHPSFTFYKLMVLGGNNWRAAMQKRLSQHPEERCLWASTTNQKLHCNNSVDYSVGLNGPQL